MTDTYQKDLQEVKKLQEKGRLIYSKEQIEEAIERIAKDLTKEIFDKIPIFLCVMNGAVVFMGQLLTRLDFPLQINYIHATRYQGEIESTQLVWHAEPTVDLKDRVVVVIEDILDSGLTLAAIIKYCAQKGAKEVYTAALIDKQRPRSPGGTEHCDFTGLLIEDKFLYGYGLDYKDYLRNVAGIYAVEG